MPTNNDHTPEQEEFARLISDLRTMPRVKAPSNFEYLLEQQIQADQQPKEAWWKRFFITGFNIGGFRVPAYAYGPVAAALVIFLGIYVFNATNFESQLPDMEADQTVPQQDVRPSPDPSPSNPAIPAEDDRKKDDDDISSPTNPPSANEPASPSIPRQMTPPTPRPIPSDIEEMPATRGASSESASPVDEERIMDQTRGRPDAFVPKKEADSDRKEGTLKEKSVELEDKMEMEASGSQGERSLMKDARRIADPRSQMMMMNLTSPADSARILDSLRRLDSLKNLQRQR